MTTERLRFYLDENVPTAIATQLQSRGIDAITVRVLELLGDEDLNHPQRATSMKRVLCTHDSDFLQLASDGTSHAGIIFGQQDRHYIGEWVKFLELVHSVYTPNDMINTIEFLQ